MWHAATMLALRHPLQRDRHRFISGRVDHTLGRARRRRRRAERIRAIVLQVQAITVERRSGRHGRIA